ncbi:hypothetical protein JCM3770_005425 [Rhodotorula araucariae]
MRARALALALALALVALATRSVAHAPAGRRSTVVRAPAETDSPAPAVVPAVPVRVFFGHGDGLAAWRGDADGASVAAALGPLSGAVPLRALYTLEDDVAPPPADSEEAEADWESPLEREHAETEERAMWRALLASVSATGEVAALFRELVGDDDYDAVGGFGAWSSADGSLFDVEVPEPIANDEVLAVNVSVSVGDARELPFRTPRRRPKSRKISFRPLPLPPTPSALCVHFEALYERLAALLPSAHPRPVHSGPVIDPKPFRLLT